MTETVLPHTVFDTNLLVLQKYRSFSERDLWQIEESLRDVALVMPGHYTDLEKVPTDVKDNIVVACALEAGAGYIVTDDRRDLLPLKVIHCPGFEPVQIVRPNAFVEILAR